jgi:nuclear pore complex protein Nup155
MAIGLVRPKPGARLLFVHITHSFADIFDPSINYLLVVATRSELQIFGVSLPQNEAGISMFATHLSVSTDDVQMTSVVGTSTGQIFLTGGNGHLYEFEYEVRLPC